MKPLTEFTTKSVKVVELWEPSMDRLSQVLEFVNCLVKEDTFLSFDPKKPITFKDEKIWLEGQMDRIKKGNLYLVWAAYNNRIIGSCDLVLGQSPRYRHVAKIGLMVDKDFRRDGIGRFMLEYILKKAKEMKVKIVWLDFFSDNLPAYRLYKKLGFKEFGRLPNGLFRKGKYSDEIDMYKEIE